ncbi:MAG: hypothetical protein VKJ64_04085 [Leptolyngbyaceae bacterium]|nr:hypothetical protein [Leptolyngbyaceae bacterium]
MNAKRFSLSVMAIALASIFSVYDRLPTSSAFKPSPSTFLNAMESPSVEFQNSTWSFEPEPDTYSDQALLDLRFLNEAVAGETGFVRRSADGQDFVAGDGSPLRFWAVNSQVWERSPQALPDHARFLAKRGVNLVRWHGNIPNQAPHATWGEINQGERDRLWQLVAAMKQEGIYVTLSPYYSQWLQPQPQWPVPRSSETMHGLLFFDPEMQSAYKEWLRQLLEPVNPYTGIALKDDPAIALLQLQNEDSLLFWTFNDIKGDDLAILQRQFGQWLVTKYGSLDAASQAWQGNSLNEDQLSTGLVAFYPLWELTQTDQTHVPGKIERLADQTEFLTETMRQFNAEMVRFLREDIGTPILINGGNWKTANALRLYDAERYSYTTTDVIGVNRYYGGVHQGEHAGWAVIAGDRFTDDSVLTQPWQFPLNLKQVAHHPMIVPESSWTPPLDHQSEGPFLVSVFQSLTGIDGFYWFTTQEAQWQHPSSANGFLDSQGKWIFATPELLGNFPAAALVYRRGYIQTASPVVQEVRPVEDLWQRRSPAISELPGFDPNRDTALSQVQAQPEGNIHPLAFLTGPVTTTYTDPRSQQSADQGTSQRLDLSQYIDSDRQIVQSRTGEIMWDYGKGLCWVDAPQVQGVTGFLANYGPITLGDISLTSTNHYATAMVVSLDGVPIAQSNRLLVQVGTRARPTGWQQTATEWTDANNQSYNGFEVINHGEAPWQVISTKMDIHVRNPRINRAIALDMNGMARAAVSLKPIQGGQQLTLPPDAKYIILENASTRR